MFSRLSGQAGGNLTGRGGHKKKPSIYHSNSSSSNLFADERRNSGAGISRGATPTSLFGPPDKSPLLKTSFYETPVEQSLWTTIDFKSEAHDTPILGMAAMETHLFTGAHQSLKVWDIN